MFTILIVEDSKEILDLMVLHLEDKYNLIKAEECIRRSQRYDERYNHRNQR